MNTYPDRYNKRWGAWHLEPVLLSSLMVLMGCGLILLYSASNANNDMMLRQSMRMGFALLALFGFAQISPHRYRLWSPWLYSFGVILLVAVLGMGKIGKGAQRWLELGLFRFQPSEIMKLATPMMAAWFLNKKPLPPSTRTTLTAIFLILLPGAAVLYFAGIRGRFVGVVMALFAILAPILWHFMHDYQRQRVFTFIDPETDPLGRGYHIIQSKIAIGSGGLLGKGWLKGSQAHLHFLPEHATDFIFAVCGEEFGWVGCLVLISIILFISLRALAIARTAPDGYGRLLAGSIAMIFFMSAFVNIGMVCGILPVVGIPLPLVSYGGTSMITLLASFGILMAIHTHRKFIPEA